MSLPNDIAGFIATAQDYASITATDPMATINRTADATQMLQTAYSIYQTVTLGETTAATSVVGNVLSQVNFALLNQWGQTHCCPR